MTPPTIHLLPLAHHHREHASRCVHLPIGRRRVAVCARCLGLYPVLAAAAAAQWALGIGPAGGLDLALALGLALPALLDWGAGWLDPRSGSTARRLITGALLGAALGRSLWLNARDPRSEVLWIQLFVLAAGALAFFLIRRLRPDGGM